MVHLGNFNVAVHFAPPEGAQPGDTACLSFMGRQLFVALPPDWERGKPLLFQAPPDQGATRSPAPLTTAPSSAGGGGRSAEQCIGVATVGVGVLGLVAGSAYMGMLVPGVLGYTLAVSFLLVAASFHWKFKSSFRSAGARKMHHGALIATSLSFALAAVGACFTQTASNFGHSALGLWVLLLWAVVHAVLVAVLCRHLASLQHLSRSASFLPWFAAGASCIVVLFVSLWTMESAGVPPASVLCHGVALFLVGVALVVGHAAPRVVPVVGKAGASEREVSPAHDDSLTLLPSLFSMLAVLTLCLVCLHASSKSGRGVADRAYACGFVVVIGASNVFSGMDVLGVPALQAACMLALTALVAVMLDASAWDRWCVALLAPVALWWRTKRTLPAVNTDAEPGDAGVANQEEARPTDETSLTCWQVLQDGCIDNRAGAVKLCCALLLSAVAAFRMAGTAQQGTVWRVPVAAQPLTAVVPFCSVVSYMASAPASGSSAAVHVATLGWWASMVPYRVMVSHAADVTTDWVFEAVVVACPLALLALARALGQEAERRYLLIALCLLLHDRVAPIGIVCFGLPALWLARRDSWEALALAGTLWQLRGHASLWGGDVDPSLWGGGVDRLLVPPSTLGLMIGVGAVLFVLAGVCGGEGHQRALFLLGLFLVPSFLRDATAGCGAFVLAVGTVAVAMVRPDSWSYLIGLAVVFCAVSSGHAELSKSATSLSALLLAVWARTRECRAHTADVAWIVALLFALLALVDASFAGGPAGEIAFGADNNWRRVAPLWLRVAFAFLHLSAYTAMLALDEHLAPLGPWTWHALPGIWAALLAAAECPWPMGATLLFGVAFIFNSPLAPALAPLLDVRRRDGPISLETSGMVWIVVATCFGVYPYGGVWELVGVAVLVLLGVTSLLRGLATVDSNKVLRGRRMGGLLSLDLGIFLGAAASEGFWQALLILVGSLVAIGLAALAASAKESSESAISEDPESRSVLVNSARHMDKAFNTQQRPL